MYPPVIIQATYENGVLRPSRRLRLTERAVVRVRVESESTTDHPHIVRDPEICGGRPVVQGTRIPVQTLVAYERLGYTLPEILAGFPGLTPAQYHDALSYYYDHQAEIEAEMQAAELPALLERFHLQADADGVLRPIP